MNACAFADPWGDDSGWPMSPASAPDSTTTTASVGGGKGASPQKAPAAAAAAGGGDAAGWGTDGEDGGVFFPFLFILVAVLPFIFSFPHSSSVLFPQSGEKKSSPSVPNLEKTRSQILHLPQRRHLLQTHSKKKKKVGFCVCS